MLGILEDASQHCRMALRDEGDEVFVVGANIEQPQDALGGSEYIKLEHGLIGGKLEIDLQLEGRVQRAVLAAIKQGVATAAHDCSDGGLAVALAEMCIAGGMGLDASNAVLGARHTVTLFGEAQSRVIVSVRPESREKLLQITTGMSVPMQHIGRVTAEPRLRLGGIDATLDELREAFEGGLPRALGGDAADGTVAWGLAPPE
jgi:phosphoribosylformylglycinamidine synthase